jgi:hypothetical protein
MSNNEFIDEKLMTSTDINQTQKTNDYEITHKPLPIYEFIYPTVTQNCDQQQIKYSLIDKNIQQTQIKFINDNINDRSLLKPVLNDIPDYTAWSVFNLIFFSFILGIWALIMSHKTKEKKSQNDLEGAQEASLITALLNTFATGFGSIIIMIYIVRYFS